MAHVKQEQSDILDLPANLVDDVISKSREVTQKIAENVELLNKKRAEYRKILEDKGLLLPESKFPISYPTTCGIDGSYSIERLLGSDILVASAVAVEGLTPPSETRHWPQPRHEAIVEVEAHSEVSGTILRALMIGNELLIAVNAPHQVKFLDGSLTTPLIYFNAGIHAAIENESLHISQTFLKKLESFLEAYVQILQATRTDRQYAALPKYTTRREIGDLVGWEKESDDRAILSMLLKPGELTPPKPLTKPKQPWHLDLPFEFQSLNPLKDKVIYGLQAIHVLYYKPSPWLPALRVEVPKTVAIDNARLGTVLYALKYQCSTPAFFEPYPLYMADQFAKSIIKLIPYLRQVATQFLAEDYTGDLSDIFLTMHEYRSESGR